jgi:hypothetical protein
MSCETWACRSEWKLTWGSFSIRTVRAQSPERLSGGHGLASGRANTRLSSSFAHTERKALLLLASPMFAQLGDD